MQLARPRQKDRSVHEPGKTGNRHCIDQRLARRDERIRHRADAAAGSALTQLARSSAWRCTGASRAGGQACRDRDLVGAARAAKGAAHSRAAAVESLPRRRRLCRRAGRHRLSGPVLADVPTAWGLSDVHLASSERSGSPATQRTRKSMNRSGLVGDAVVRFSSPGWGGRSGSVERCSEGAPRPGPTTVGPWHRKLSRLWGNAPRRTRRPAAIPSPPQIPTAI